MRVARGPLGIPLPSMPVHKILCGVSATTSGFLSNADMDLGYFWSVPRGVSARLEWGHARLPSSRAVAAVSCFPWSGSRDLSFPRGFPKRLSHEAFPQGCPTCHRGVCRSSQGKSRQCRENRFPWNGLRHLGNSRNGGTTLEFLSPFLWRAPPLEMQRERGEFLPLHAGKGSLLWS